MAILNNFDQYFSNANLATEKNKQVPAGTYEAEVTELNIQKSDKSGARIIKLKYKITSVDTIEQGQSEELELDPSKLVGRNIKSTECAQIKTDKQKFIADRWMIIASKVVDRSDLEKSFQANLIDGNGDFDGFLSDILSDLSKVISKGKKTLAVTIKRERDGEYWRTKIQMPQSDDAIH